MTIKALALDMDGTLLDSTNRIDARLVERLTDLHDRGVRIILASGRTYPEMEAVLPDSFPFDGAVTTNGMSALTRDRWLFQRTLDENLVNQVIRELDNYDVYYEFHNVAGNRMTFQRDKARIVAEANETPPPTVLAHENHSRLYAVNHEIIWVDEIDPNDVVKLYFFSMQMDGIDQWKKRLEEMKAEHPFVTSSSSLHNVEIMTEGVSKATGMEAMLEELSLSKEHLMAIGDGENDLPMLEMASYTAAMRNAPETVQAQTDDVTQFTNEENGLLHYLEAKIAEGLFDE